MDPNIFRKGEASSVLVPEKTWEDVLDKPDNLEAVARRVVEILEAADGKVAYSLDQMVADMGSILRSETDIPHSDVHRAVDGIVEVYENMLAGDYSSRSAMEDAVSSVIVGYSPSGTDIGDSVNQILLCFRMLSGEAYLMSKDTLRDTKDAINRVLGNPLLEDIGSGGGSSGGVAGENAIPVDAFWDEIDGVPEGLRAAIARFYQMKLGLANFSSLGSETGLGDVKYVLNNAVLQPLKGDIEYE